MLYINFKTYQSGTGEKAGEMAAMMRRLSLVTGVAIIPVMQVVDLYRGAAVEKDWVWGQHVDAVEYGAHTGWILPETVKETTAAGVVLNHAEHKIRQDGDRLRKTFERCRAVGLKIGICADSLEEIEAVRDLRPEWIAYEPPELIGSSELSVSTSKPEVVAEAVKLAGEVDLLIGAGIKDANDIRIGLSLGAKGFLIASAVMKAEDPEAKLRELVSGY